MDQGIHSQILALKKSHWKISGKCQRNVEGKAMGYASFVMMAFMIVWLMDRQHSPGADSLIVGLGTHLWAGVFSVKEEGSIHRISLF